MQDEDWEANMSCRCLEHSLILLATAPRLTRLTLSNGCVPRSEASRWLQSLQHLKHLKHLTAVGPAAAGDALNSMLMVRFRIWHAELSMYHPAFELLASMWSTMGKVMLVLLRAAQVQGVVLVQATCTMGAHVNCRVYARH